MENTSPEVRASGLLSLNVKKTLPADLKQSVIDHMADPDESVRQAAILALVPLQLHAAVPRLLELAAKPTASDYATAVEALCGLRDPRAVSIYLVLSTTLIPASASSPNRPCSPSETRHAKR